jgi:biopolymer transport protein ExbD
MPPPITLLKAGITTLVVAALFFWGIARHLEPANYSDVEEIGGLAQYAFLCLGAAGIVLVLRGLSLWLLGPPENRQSLRIFPDLVLRNVLPLRRHRPMALVNEPPHYILLSYFPLFYCWMLNISMFLFMVDTPLTPRGFTVNFGKPRVALWQNSPVTETLGVYVDCPAFYVNGQRAEREELRAKLKEELGKRIVWTVYLEARDDCRFSDAVYAMDAIHELGGKLVWLTPRTREEINRQ